MNDCVVCDGLGCEHCPKVRLEEFNSDQRYFVPLWCVFLWCLVFWLALADLIGWLT